MRVLILGDLHGELGGLAQYLGRVRALFRIGAAVQVGDFGFFRGGFAPGAEPERFRFPVPVYAVDGNHEDHAWLKEQWDSGAALGWREAHNLYYQPRGSVATLGASRVGFLGGALNIDQPQRQDLASGAANFIRDAEVAAAAEAFNTAGVDLVVTHACPTDIGIGLEVDRLFQQGVVNFVVSVGLTPGSRLDCGDVQLTALWRALSPKPRAWVFGHFHREHERRVDGTLFRCLGRHTSAKPFPLVFWDTEERQLVVVSG